MKSGCFIAMAATVCLAGCGQSGANNPLQTSEPTTVDLLAAGSPQACSAADVRATLISMVKPDISPTTAINNDDIQVAQSEITYNLDLITLASVDKSVKSVSCDANLTVTSKHQGSQTFQIRYQIRPSVEDETNFIINSDVGPAKEIAARWGFDEAFAAYTDRQSAEAAANPSPPTDNATGPDENTSTEDAGAFPDADQSSPEPAETPSPQSQPTDQNTPATTMPKVVNLVPSAPPAD